MVRRDICADLLCGCDIVTMVSQRAGRCSSRGVFILRFAVFTLLLPYTCSSLFRPYSNHFTHAAHNGTAVHRHNESTYYTSNALAIFLSYRALKSHRPSRAHTPPMTCYRILLHVSAHLHEISHCRPDVSHLLVS